METQAITETQRRGSVPHPDVQRYSDVNRDVLKVLGKPGLGWWALLVGAAAAMGLFFSAWIIQMLRGIGVSGLISPVGWGVYITTFVFWVGIAHSGTLISAILFLFRAPWRQSVYRAAEAMTVFAVMTAGLFPLIHVGRVWYGYWLIPYPNSRFLWPNFRSPLVMDVFAVTTYFTVSATFFYLGAIPDLAAARDQATGFRKTFYTIAALGWQGSDREWHHFGNAYVYLAALATPLVLSVHSVVSWDFALGIVPGWHATIFAPYFVAGAIFSGVAMVITLTVPIRKIFHLEAYLTTKHFDALAKLCLATSLIVLYAYLTEFFMAWYGGEEIEKTSFWSGRLFGNYWWAAWIMLTCNGLVPIMLWFKRVRHSIPALFVISLFINIGMWFERFVIIITSLSHEYEPFAWGVYRPSVVEMSIVLGSFGWFSFWFLLFTRLIPPIAVAELKEVLPAPMRNSHAHGHAEAHHG
jgi:molybdopterin-containing oxidoreductase family membrane subunit